MENKYVKIKVHDGSSYIQPLSELHQALDGELDDFHPGRKITIEIINVSKEDYEKLPEFTGH